MVLRAPTRSCLYAAAAAAKGAATIDKAGAVSSEQASGLSRQIRAGHGAGRQEGMGHYLM